MAKKKSERFDATEFAAAKLKWVRKVVGDARKCAIFYNMDEVELRQLGHFLATGEMTANGKPMSANPEQQVKPEIREQLEKELARLNGGAS